MSEREIELKSALSESSNKLVELEQQLKETVDAKQQLQIQNIDLLSEVDSLKIEKESLENEKESLENQIRSNLDDQLSQLR